MYSKQVKHLFWASALLIPVCIIPILSSCGGTASKPKEPTEEIDYNGGKPNVEGTNWQSDVDPSPQIRKAQDVVAALETLERH
ncbi:MAG: hypothetical protein LBV22_02075 [Mycoplasmataceae bacterium]|jgi:hypothetical protein|nr:hypothetical protein [Mycoplasmataceae bacterium]